MEEKLNSKALDVPNEWKDICEYADGRCLFSKRSDFFYKTCINGDCTLRYFAQLSDYFTDKLKIPKEIIL